MDRIREYIRRFLADPLGTAIEGWVYLLLLGIGLVMLIGAGKWFMSMISAALRLRVTEPQGTVSPAAKAGILASGVGCADKTVQLWDMTGHHSIVRPAK
jgi:hypothetical protein